MPPPTSVTTSQEAFDRIRTRLESDVGFILSHYKSIIKPGDPVAFFAFLRMLFPIAESIGDLLYRKSGTAANLQMVLENEFSKFNSQYANLSAILTLLYRHSLTHQDEMRQILYKTNFVFWSITFGVENQHLTISKLHASDPKALFINFDVTQFYEDILALCITKRSVPDQAIADRYFDWQILDLDKQKLSNVERESC